jgi:hypothetical protein
MPVITEPSTFKKKLPPRTVEENPISGSNWASSCLYNLPRGCLLVLIPGFAILIIGVVFIALTGTAEDVSIIGEGIQLVAIIFLSVGGSLTVMGIIYWLVMWFRHRPESLRTKDPSNNMENVLTKPAQIEITETSVDGSTIQLVSFVWSPRPEVNYGYHTPVTLGT